MSPLFLTSPGLSSKYSGVGIIPEFSFASSLLEVYAIRPLGSMMTRKPLSSRKVSCKRPSRKSFSSVAAMTPFTVQSAVA